MPKYPTPPYPAGLTADQYHLLWSVVWEGKILLVGHLDAQQPTMQGLITKGFVTATPKLTTPEARAQCAADLAHCYDALAAIPRAEWPARYEDAEQLFSQATWRRRQLIESNYRVADAGYALVRQWENGGRDTAIAQLTPKRFRDLCQAARTGRLGEPDVLELHARWKAWLKAHPGTAL